MSGKERDVSELLELWRSGEPQALDELFPLVYDELRRLASARLRREPQGATMQTTVLVHEAYLRLAGKARAQVRDRSHFFAVAAQAMRRILIDRARRRRARKRDAAQVVPDRHPLEAQSGVTDEELLALDRALEKLASLDLRQARVVELRYFGGLTAVEAAETLGISEATVQREWRAAKIWLRREMSGAAGASESAS